MVHSAPSHVSHDRHQVQEQEQDERHSPSVLLQHHHQSRSNDWMSTRGLEAVFSSSPPPARRHERLLHFRSAFSEFECRDHRSPSTHLNVLSLRDGDYYFEDLEQARGSNAAGISVAPAAEIAATQVRSTAATIRRQYQQQHNTQPPGHRERQPDDLVGSNSTHNLGDASHSLMSKTALGFIMNRGEQPRSQLENAGDADSPNMLSHWDSQSRCASPRIAARVGVYQAPYDARGEDGEEEKNQAIYGPAGTTGYSSDQAHDPRPRAAAQIRLINPTAIVSHQVSRAFADTAPPPPPSTPTRLKQTAVAAGKARPRVRPAPPANNQGQRRARKCKVAECPNYIINKGLCFRHGGGKKCSEDGCPSSAKHAGKCWKHGGSLKCLVETCTRKGKTRGLCWSHGGGTKCSNASCSKVAISNGFCWAHGGGKRCAFDGCTKAASKRTHNYCVAHHELLKDGNVTLKV